MDVYKLIALASTPGEIAVLLDEMSKETKQYRDAFYAAKAFIESHIADPDLTAEMVEKYEAYKQASKGI